jgi:hypothetical protein
MSTSFLSRGVYYTFRSPPMFLSILLFWTITLYLRGESDWQSASAQGPGSGLDLAEPPTEKKELRLRSDESCRSARFGHSNPTELASAE